jgi:hypothetical protein
MTSIEDQLGELGQEPPAANRIDVAETMREGRRRRRTRQIAGGTALGVAVLLAATGGIAVGTIRTTQPPLPAASKKTKAVVSPGPATPKTCKVTRLPTDGVVKSVVTGADHTGHWAAGRLYGTRARGDYPLVIWKDGAFQKTIDVSGEDQSIEAMNAKGDGAGSTFLNGDVDNQKAFAYVGGKVTLLPGDEQSVAAAITDAGVIGGSSGDRPAVWRTPASQPELLPLPEGATSGSVNGIAEDGTILGTVGTPTADDATSYLWLPDGKLRKIPFPKATEGDTKTVVQTNRFWGDAIRGDWVVGTARHNAGTAPLSGATATTSGRTSSPRCPGSRRAPRWSPPTAGRRSTPRPGTAARGRRARSSRSTAW